MAKIKPIQIFVSEGYLYVIDETGKMWNKHIPNGAWLDSGTLPDQV
jgi:hypothetical protein